MKQRPLTKLERYGILGLLILLSAYFVVKHYILNTAEEPKYTVDFIDHADTLDETEITDSKYTFIAEPTNDFEGSKLEDFYPDSLSKEDWIKLNFSPKQADVILNFKNSSGGFHHENDLKKIYVISDEKFQELSPHMKFVALDSSHEKFELNSASETDLKSIKGIGDVLAARIKKYQKSIGGFKTYNELENVYGLESNVIEEIKIRTTLNPPKININKASKDELLRIPGFDFEIVSLIIKERDKKRLTNLDFLSEEYLNSEQKETANKYLEFK